MKKYSITIVILIACLSAGFSIQLPKQESQVIHSLAVKNMSIGEPRINVETALKSKNFSYMKDMPVTTFYVNNKLTFARFYMKEVSRDEMISELISRLGIPKELATPNDTIQTWLVWEDSTTKDKLELIKYNGFKHYSIILQQVN